LVPVRFHCVARKGEAAKEDRSRQPRTSLTFSKGERRSQGVMPVHSSHSRSQTQSQWRARSTESYIWLLVSAPRYDIGSFDSTVFAPCLQLSNCGAARGVLRCVIASCVQGISGEFDNTL
jgi:hypothetical protein